MKKIFNKIKASLVVFRVALISFPLKVKGLWNWEWKDPDPQPDYWIYYPSEKLLSSPVEETTIIDTIIKTVPRLLVAITFIVWIVSFIKIRKIDDRTLKKKKTKKAVVIIIILITLIIIAFLLSARLLGCTTCWWVI